MKIGDKVKTVIYIAGEPCTMYTGIIIEDCNGFYRIDIGSLHGCEPWIVIESSSHLIPFVENRE